MKQKMRELLIKAAQNKKNVTYKQLAVKLGIKATYYGFESKLYRVLEEIGNEEIAAGRALLNSLVVRRSDRMPGGGFYTWYADQFDLDEYRISDDDKIRIATELQLDCYQYWEKMALMC